MAYPEKPIIIVDDDEAFLRSARLSLFAEGLEYILTFSDGNQVLACLEKTDASLITLDLTMPAMDGLTLLQQIVLHFPQIPVIILTGSVNLDAAVTCMKAGAKDYLVKPIDPDRLVKAVRQCLEHLDVLQETDRLRASLLRDGVQNPEAFSLILTQSPCMTRIFKYAEAISRTGMPVLISGETGTGKELMAKALHQLRHPRAPFIAVNVAGLDDVMFSDTLFGHQKGAFTGALSDRKGLVEQADEGTLFLDEIGDLAPESQIKLLRLIQEGEFYPIGAERPRKVRLWVVTATNRPIGSMPNFRKDLFYRLQSHWIELPPLRERQGDVGLLLNSFLENAAQILNRECPADFGTRLELRLRGYGFPGNIRELQGLVFDVLGSAGTDGSINEDVLRRWINLSETVEEAVAVDRDPINFVRFGASLPTMRELEHLLIEEALSRTNQNQTATATLLGISRQTLLNHKKRANI